MAMSPDRIKEIADRAEGVKLEKSEARTGRPAKYKDTYAKQAEKLCSLGATDEDLADFFEVSIRTIANWKAQHEDFLQALKGGKAQADDRVERSLYQRAVGYSFDSEKVFNNRGEIVRANTREHCPPDVTAQIFWLKNRRPDDWRDKIDHHHSGSIQAMTDDAIDARIAQILGAAGIAGPAGGAGATEDPS